MRYRVSLVVTDEDDGFTNVAEVTVLTDNPKDAVRQVTGAADTLLERINPAVAARPVTGDAEPFNPPCGQKFRWLNRPEGDDVSTCDWHGPHDVHVGPTQQGTAMTWTALTPRDLGGPL